MTAEPVGERLGIERELSMQVGRVELKGTLALPMRPVGLVITAHGSGSSRHSPRNRYVAQVLQAQAIGTLLFDLLTSEEEAVDDFTREFRFSIPFLTERLARVSLWALSHPETRWMKLGYFGASTGAAAALRAAVELPREVVTIVSRGGRPDLAGDRLPLVSQPTLLIVGERDPLVMEMNREALKKIRSSESKLVIIPGATHLFEEKGALEKVAETAAAWFRRQFAAASAKRLPLAAGCV